MTSKWKKCLLLGALVVPLLVGCEPSDDPTASNSLSGGDNTSETLPPSDPLPTDWDGTVRIYYRNDMANYMSKCIWVWGVGIDGEEYEFDNAGNPDDYGVYYDVHLDEAPWNLSTHTSISFIIKDRGTWAGQSADIVCNLNDYSSTLETDENGKERITIYSWDLGNARIDVSPKRSDALGDRIGVCEFTDWRTLHIEGTGVLEDNEPEREVGLITSYELYAYDASWYRKNSGEQIGSKPDYLIKSGTPNSSSFDITFDEDIKLYTDYVIECRFAQNPDGVKQGGATLTTLYDTEKFQEEYTYTGNDLGFTDLTDETRSHYQFKVWAPTAGNVSVRLYTSGTPVSLGTSDNPGNDNSRLEPMTPDGNGVWKLDLYGFYCDRFHFYTYAVSNAGTTVEAADPYAISSGINGVRSAILNREELAATYPEGWEESLEKFKSNPEDPTSYISPNQLTIYEVHVRDFTADDTWVSHEGNERGTYKAFVEEGTTYEGVTTGFDSLKELGVSAVQLLPVFDQDNDERTYVISQNGQEITQKPSYNWGYNPQNYNVVEGSYSSDPYDPAVRMLEYREMIQALADNGIRTIMDVVYNHMSSVSNSSFNKIVPDYFFKTDENGSYIDETGVHNTFATNRPMGSKFVVDSTRYWLENFGIQGFRFDLMGAIETSTMRDVKDMAYEIDPNIVVYGEPWRGSGYSSSTQAGKEAVYQQLNDNGKGSVGAFNDCGRNALKGDTTWGSPAPSYGFMSQGAGDFDSNTMYNAACVYLGENREMTQKGIATPANQTVNYVSCHDNYTLYDQLNYTFNQGHDADTDDNEVVKEAVLGTTAFVLMSQGIAFIHGGEEILRQKVMTPENEYWDKIEENDYVELPSGNRLIRNSYAYGDEVNSYKWDRKVKFKDYFDKYAEATQARKTLIEEGILGIDYDTYLQGSYGENNTKVTRLWDTLTETGSYCGKDNVLRPVLAAQTEFTKVNNSSLPDVYVFLGGRMNDTASCPIGIGAGELEVLYSTKRDAGTRLSVTNSLDIYGYEMMIVARRS